MNQNNLDAHYPNKRTIKRILENNIPLILNTDAHSINGLDKFYYEALEELKKFGVKKMKMLIDGSFKDIDINLFGKNIN